MHEKPSNSTPHPSNAMQAGGKWGREGRGARPMSQGDLRGKTVLGWALSLSLDSSKSFVH